MENSYVKDRKLKLKKIRNPDKRSIGTQVPLLR